MTEAPLNGLEELIEIARQAASDVARDDEAAAPAIAVENLVKRYPNGTEAVRGISFSVDRGELFGILGPNGAGKSTTIGVLGTLVRPTSGRAVVAGLDVVAHPKEVRTRIGFAMQEVGLDELATGFEFLVLQGRLQGLPKSEATRRARILLRLVDLEDAADRRLGAYSGGMKRRVDLASAMIHLPRILFLDEPTEGLDPHARAAIWETLQRLNQELSITVVLTTHYMEEADRLCSRIGIIDRGQIVVEETPDRLKASVGGESLLLSFGSESSAGLQAQAQAALADRSEVDEVVATNGDLSVYVKDAAALAPELLRTLERRGATPKAVSIRQPSLEDVYLRYTGRTFERAEARPNGNGAGGGEQA
ncbi:MAG: ATP-binding cassette domain-containing protein [Solirubrobacterales bacterium]